MAVPSNSASSEEVPPIPARSKFCGEFPTSDDRNVGLG